MRMSVNASVVGVGKIGLKHARILASMPAVTLSSVVDTDADRAADVAETLGCRTGSLDEAVSEADCLFVCTPDNEHTEIALQAIDNGVNTFVEKPLATTTSETRQLRTAAVESDRVHMVGHILRFDPRYQAVRDLVAAGDLGDVVSVTMTRFVKRARVQRTGAVSRAPLRLGVHDFDLLEWMFDTNVQSIGAHGADGHLPEEGYDLEETVSVLATLDGNATATLAMGFCLPDGHPGSIVRTTAIGTDESTVVDASSTETQHWDDTTGTAVDTHLWPDVDGVPGGALAAQDHAFVNAVRRDVSSPVPFADGHRAVQLAEATEEAVDTGTRIDSTSN